MSEKKLKWTPYKSGQFYLESEPSSYELKFLKEAAMYEMAVLGPKDTEPNGFPCVSDTHTRIVTGLAWSRLFKRTLSFL